MCSCTSEVRADARPGMTAGWNSRLIQIDIEFVRAVAADQRQFERRASGVRARRQAVELEGETLDPGGAMFEQLRNRQRPVRGWTLDKQTDFLGVGADYIDQHGGFSIALDVANGQRVG